MIVSQRLTKIRCDLANLDDEIASIQDELNSSTKSINSQYSFNDESQTQSFTSDISSTENSEINELMLPRNSINIPGYIPPSERIYDHLEKQKKFRERALKDRELEFQQEYTFHPKISRKSKNLRYNTDHLLKPNSRKYQIEEQSTQNYMNSYSKHIANNYESKTNTNFLSRQFKKNNQNPQQTISNPTKTITSEQEKEMIERLTKPKVSKHFSPNTNKSLKKQIPSSPNTFERLVTSSMKKVKVEEIKNNYQSKMDPNSRKISENIKTDLFEESVEKHNRIMKQAEEVKRWKELADAAEYSFKPELERRHVSVPKKVKVADVEIFLERMRKNSQQNEENKNKQKLPCKTYRKKSKEKNVQNGPPPPLDPKIESILNEIDMLL